MIQAFDVLLQIPVTADIAAKNRIDEPFRYECLCCGEEVYIAATNSTKKAPHFRHRRGNSDRECELYLGSTGIAGALNAAQKRTHSRTEIYFDIKQKIFYAAVSFPKEKLQEFEDKSCICNRIAGIALAKCVSNTLCGSQEIKVLSYTSEVTSNDILNYLRLETRICVLDGFLGNYNEMELISILRSIKGRIIFITFNYERTMAYLPQEILLYFNYVNVSRIKGFFSEAIIDEDASVIPEEWTSVAHKSVNGRAERLCNEIMKQLGFGADVTMLLSQRMISEEKLVQYLAFSILPYSSEALDCRPYEVSDRLQKYAGEQGKCKQKSLLLGWFGNE